jgi:exonuclease III
MDVKSLCIAEWNANGLANHKLELIQFLHDNNIDILLASETHFTDRTVLKIPQYSLYHSNHPDVSAHGGSEPLYNTSKHPPIEQTKSKHLSSESLTDPGLCILLHCTALPDTASTW